MKLLQSAKMGRRYHPQIIRFALSLHGKSSSAYRELRDSGAHILPSERGLYNGAANNRSKQFFATRSALNAIKFVFIVSTMQKDL